MKKKIPLILGLTGGIATGKTTAAKMFLSLGAKVIDADSISHRLMDEDEELKKRLISAYSNEHVIPRGRDCSANYLLSGNEHVIPRGRDCSANYLSFGKDVLGKNGRIKRKELAALTFGNPSALRRLNKIMHPAIISRIRKELKESKQGVTVLDAPLLIEAGLSDMVDKLIVVKADKKIQISRARRKTGASEEEIKKRIQAQMPLSEKVARADYVIDNNGRLDETRKQVKEIWKEVNSSLQQNAA